MGPARLSTLAMKRKTIFSYFAFGYNYRLLRTMDEGDSIHGDSNSTASRIDELFSWLDEHDLKVTKGVAWDLQQIRTELDSLPTEAKLTKELIRKVKDAVTKLDATLDAELQLRDAYIITPKRYDVERLMDRPSELLAKDVFRRLSDKAKRDFSLGCQCIAFTQPTSAAFHFLRATEEMLRELYCSLVPKKNRPVVLLWAPMVEAMRAKRGKKPKGELLDHLDLIRRNYRNPTQHPELFYDLDGAQDLLSNCASALNMICAVLPDVTTDEPPF